MDLGTDDESEKRQSADMAASPETTPRKSVEEEQSQISIALKTEARTKRVQSRGQSIRP